MDTMVFSNWTIGNGMHNTHINAHGITVRATDRGPGLRWLRVESADDPCPRGALKLEAGVEVLR